VSALGADWHQFIMMILLLLLLLPVIIITIILIPLPPHTGGEDPDLLADGG
jgi:hypothetical protein